MRVRVRVRAKGEGEGAHEGVRASVSVRGRVLRQHRQAQPVVGRLISRHIASEIAYDPSELRELDRAATGGDLVPVSK